MNKKIVILLGAGAAIPFGGPTTAELTEITKAITPHWITEPLVKAYPDGYNFETIISAIELLFEWYLNKEAIETKNRRPENILLSRYLFKPDIDFCTNSVILWDYYCECINCIIDRIAEYDYIRDNSNRLYQDLYSFINSLRGGSNPVKIYSLNYDRLIPQIIESQDQIIDEGVSMGSYTFEIHQFVNSHLTYNNLHGNIYLKQLVQKQYRTDLCSEKQHLELPNYIIGGNPSHNSLFSPIITGYEKSSRLLSEPFTFGISCFTYDCSTCSDLYIIGYSFSDPHINSILRDYVQNDSIVRIIDYNRNNKLSENLSDHFAHIWNAFPSKVDQNNTFYTDMGQNLIVCLSGVESFLKSRDYELSSHI